MKQASNYPVMQNSHMGPMSTIAIRRLPMYNLRGIPHSLCLLPHHNNMQ